MSNAFQVLNVVTAHSDSDTGSWFVILVLSPHPLLLCTCQGISTVLQSTGNEERHVVPKAAEDAERLDGRSI